jgi:hypothetical protein
VELKLPITKAFIEEDSPSTFICFVIVEEIAIDIASSFVAVYLALS